MTNVRKIREVSQDETGPRHSQYTCQVPRFLSHHADQHLSRSYWRGVLEMWLVDNYPLTLRRRDHSL